MSRRMVIALLLLSLIGGCAENQARHLALQTLKSVNDYDKQVSNKVMTEMQFYRVQRETIRKHILGATDLMDKEPPVEVSAKKTPVVKPPADGSSNPIKTIYYGRIVQSAERDALALADKWIHESTSEIMSGIIDYVRRGLEHEEATYTELLKREKTLNLAILEKLEKIDRQENRLAQVRRALMTLSKNPTNTEQLKALGEIAKTIREQLKDADQE